MTQVIRQFFARSLSINRPLTFGLILLFSFSFHQGFSQDSTWISVHFIYGSKPKKQCKSQKEWFGGLHGGHVGIEYDSGQVIDFVPQGEFHYIGKRKECHSAYTLRSLTSFWHTFQGHDSASVKAASIRIPISLAQRQTLDSLVKSYTAEVPYDYAFLGMRCASASYDILDEIGVMPARSHVGTWFHIFYPKRLRIRMLKRAKRKGWEVWKKEGVDCRIWEKD